MARAARGRKAFLLKLKRLKTAVRIEIETAIERNAKDVAKLARAFAEGSRQSGDLIRSIRAEAILDGQAKKWAVIAGDEKAFHARWVEFGTAPSAKGATVTNASGRSRKSARTHPGTAARPYFFPAYRALRRRLKNRLSRAFTKAKRKALA